MKKIYQIGKNRTLRKSNLIESISSKYFIKRTLLENIKCSQIKETSIGIHFGFHVKQKV